MGNPKKNKSKRKRKKALSRSERWANSMLCHDEDAGLSLEEVMELVPDDLPDGAALAMAYDIAGLEYGS